jgi:hypothetical protein
MKVPSCLLLVIRYNEVKAAVRDAEASPADGDKIPAQHGEGSGQSKSRLGPDGSAPQKIRITKVS